MTPDELLLYMGGTLLLILCIFIGRFLDPAWRTTKLRQFTKKPYIMAKVFNKDARLVNTHVINAINDSLWIGNAFWAFTKGTVVIERKNSDGKLERDKEAGFKITSDMLRTDEGCPTLYLDGDKMRPLQIWEPAAGQDTKPNEVGAIMLGWNANQELKASRGMGNNQIFILILLGMMLFTLWIAWSGLQEAHTASVNTGKLLDYMNQTGVVASAPGGPTVNIVQPRG